MKRIPRICFIVLAIVMMSCQLPSLLSPVQTGTPTIAIVTPVVPTPLLPTDQPTNTVQTPISPAGEIEAEISLPDVAVSADGTVIRVGIAILNHGVAFTLSLNDVSLVQQDGAPIAMASSEPPLPKEIAAGVAETLYFVFPRPATPTATLKILTTEYTIEGY